MSLTMRLPKWDTRQNDVCIYTDLNTRKVGKELTLIRNNTRKVYGLKLFLVMSKCGLKIEIIEGFIKGLMWVFL